MGRDSGPRRRKRGLLFYPSTVAYIRRHVNSAVRVVIPILVRAVVIALALAVLSGIAILLNLLLKYVAGVYGVPEDIQTKMAQLALSFPIVLAIVVTIAGVVDALKIAFASIQSPSESDTLNHDEDTAK